MKDLSGKITGDQYTAVEFDDYFGENKNQVNGAGITLSDGDNKQLAKSSINYSSFGDFYADAGAANAYVLNKIAPKEGITAYKDGVRVRFIAANANTGASTVNVNGLGVKDIKKFNGSSYIALEANDIPIGYEALLSFRESSDLFELVGFVEEATETRRGIIEIATDAEVLAATDTGKAVVPAYIINHPGVAKAYLSWTWGNTTPLTAYNISSIAFGTHTITVTLSVTMSDANFVVNSTLITQGRDSFAVLERVSATQFILSFWDWDGDNTDRSGCCAVFGELAS